MYPRGLDQKISAWEKELGERSHRDTFPVLPDSRDIARDYHQAQNYSPKSTPGGDQGQIIYTIHVERDSEGKLKTRYSGPGE